MITSSYARRCAACFTAIAALAIAACSSDKKDTTPTVAQTLFIVSDGTSEGKLLTEIYSQSLEKAGFRVSRRDPVADLAAGYALLKSGAADFFVTHTNDLLQFLVKNEPAAAASTSTTGAPTTTNLETTTTGASSGDGTATTTLDTTSGSASGNGFAPSAAATTTTAKAPVATTTTVKSSTTTTTKKSTTTTADTTGDTTGDSTDTTGDSTDPTTGDTTDSTTGDSTGDSVDAAVTTTSVSPGQAAAESINGQSNLIGEVLPDTLQIGTASDAENKDVIACNNGVSTTGSLVTLSDVARAADVLSLAGPASFTTDTPFGLPGFQKIYGEDVEFKTFDVKEAADLGPAVESPTTTIDTSVTTTIAPTTTGETTTTVLGPTPTTEAAETTTTTIPANLLPDDDCVATNSLDITLPNDVVVMDDNLNWIATNGVVPVLTKTAATPGVTQVVDGISQELTTTDLRVMLKAMNDESTSPEAMASRYIASKNQTGS